MGIQCDEFLPTSRNMGTSCAHSTGDCYMNSFCCVVIVCLDTRHSMLVCKLTSVMSPKGCIFYLSFYSHNHIFHYLITLLWTGFIWLRTPMAGFCEHGNECEF